MYKIKSQRGQAIILLAFAIVGLVGFGALAIDGGRVLSDRRHAQNAADTAVLAAALTKIQGGTFAQMTTAAQVRAFSNGYNNGTNGNGSNSVVEVNLCSDSGVTCQGLPGGANPSEYIRVRITSNIPMTFARVIGRPEAKNVVEAIARAQGTTSGGSFFGGAAMVATKGGDYSQCFLVNGGADLYTHDSGIYVNCSNSQAMFINGGATVEMDANGQIVGCFAKNGNPTVDPITCGVNGGVSQTIDASTFADVPTTLPPPTCSQNGTMTTSGSTVTLTPGNFTNITLNSGVTATMQPGVYCISGSFNLNGNATLQGPSGSVQMVLQNQNIILNGGGVIDFNDLEIYGVGADFTLNGGAIFRADRLRYFSTGSGDFIVNGNAEVTSGNAYFYFYNGVMTWNGNSILNLTAPPQGDPFGGLLVHLPWNNTNNITMNGGSTVNLTGTFMAPHCPITFNGGVDFDLHSQIIGYTYIVNGGGTVDIYFEASQNYQPPNKPTIELTK